MNKLVTGEAEAKAILKGIIRRTIAVGDTILDKRIKSSYINAKRSVKVVNEYHKDNLAWYGDFLMSESKFKTPGLHPLKQNRCEYRAIEPELLYADNIGNLSRFVVNFFDSRKYTKGKIDSLAKFTSQFYFHEHFLIRCIQRLNKRIIGEAINSIYPVIEFLITENLPITRVEDNSYFVFRDFIVVTEKLPSKKGLIFKTIKLTSRLNLNDETKFSDALTELKESNPLTLAALMTNKNGQVIRHISPAIGKSLLLSYKKESFWLQPIFTSQDIRNDYYS